MRMISHNIFPPVTLAPPGWYPSKWARFISNNFLYVSRSSDVTCCLFTFLRVNNSHSPSDPWISFSLIVISPPVPTTTAESPILSISPFLYRICVQKLPLVNLRHYLKGSYRAYVFSTKLLCILEKLIIFINISDWLAFRYSLYEIFRRTYMYLGGNRRGHYIPLRSSPRFRLIFRQLCARGSGDGGLWVSRICRGRQ